MIRSSESKIKKKIPIHLANQNLFVIFDSLRRFKMNRFGPSPFSDISVYGKNQTYHDSWIIFFPITFSVLKNLSRLFRLKYRQKVTARIFDCKKYGKNPWRHKLFELSKVWVIQLKLSQPSAPVSALDINELNVDLKISPTLLGPLYWHIKYIKPFLPKTQIKSFVNTWEIFEIIRGAIFNKFWTKTRTQMFLSIFFAKFWWKKYSRWSTMQHFKTRCKIIRQAPVEQNKKGKHLDFNILTNLSRTDVYNLVKIKLITEN